ncbi:glycosyltransferase family 9 protein [Aquirufa rosea]|uniref:Lipopolysaccharide heptosyltransferase family protein n=1 Tax=Aquirufa rosea TaxID=2509241 RepID=A0A4Q1BYT4_9BACT|nr:glycosyltransferase family 9 protein [Aquirufa rosea]RXK48175.1 lipopolysaccharide heptosyltransferase family protein [Aquirufa rosea]
MPSIYLRTALWQYKFRKLSYLFAGLIAYCRFCVWVIFQRILQPNRPVVGVLLAQHLGDIVASEPIIPALNAKYPNAKVVWIIQKHFRPLLEQHPGLYRLITEENMLFSYFLCQWNPCNHFFNLHLNELRKDPFFHIPLVNEKAYELNINIHNYYNQHNLLENFSQLAGLGLISGHPQIYLPKKKFIPPFEGNYWLIHRISNDPCREWSYENWMKLVKMAIEEWDVNIVEMGTSQGLEFDHPKFLSLVGKTTVEESLFLVQSADYFIGIDSGPTHCANAFQIPALIMLGEFADFKKYMSYSGAYQQGKLANLIYCEHGPAKDLSFEEVWQKIQNSIETHHLITEIPNHK